MAKLLVCKCSQCKIGIKSSWEQENIKQKKSGFRSRVRVLLKQLKYEQLPTSIYIGYPG
jgi:hypothetical protein